MIFVNLPVSNLPHSMAFYEALGFTLLPVARYFRLLE